MISVTLGTHPKPMDRLVLALDALIANGEIREEVVITAAVYGTHPVLATALGIQPFGELRDMIDSASAVITHGGPASIALALASGHTPLIVPRDPAFDEHVDDHQVRFASWLSSRRPVVVVRDMGGLGVALAGVLAGEATRTRHPFVAEQAVAHLRTILARGR